MLSREYAYFDGTFKRCPGYATLACHVYIEVLGTIVKIFTMETESESTECTELCWKLFNAAMREFTGDENIVFNPCGWVQDEAAGFWNVLRNVFGETAVNRSVSCEWHYSQSYKNQMARLKPGGIVFEKIANRLMLALSENEYEVTLNDQEDFIDENNEDRGFLNDWIAWWDRRREHFSKAYKNPSAPTTNISECYNSKYVRVKEINLKLVDAAKLDIAEALRFERTHKKFGEGMPVDGTGPSSSQRLGRDINEQKRRARKYAEAICDDIDDINKVGSKKRRQWRNDDATPGSNKRREKYRATPGSSKRSERFRTSRSRKFVKSLALSKENHRHITLLSVNQISEKSQQCSIKYFNKIIKVDIQEKPACSCSFFLHSNERSFETCLHIIWTLLNYYQITEGDPILHQVAWTSKEVNDLFDLTPNVEILSSGTVFSSTMLTPTEEETILESKDSNLRWKLSKLKERKTHIAPVAKQRCLQARCMSK